MPAVQMIESSRGAFQVRHHGSKSAPLILALHGFPDVASTFDGLGEALADAGFQVAGIQARGYQPSPRAIPKGRHLFDVMALDALAVAEAIAPGRAFGVLGHDNGAFATYSLLRIAGAQAWAAVTLTAAHPAAVFKNSGRLPAQM